MTHPPLAIFGYSQAAMFVRGELRPRVDAVISIHGAREFGIEADAKHRLDLSFDDVDVPVHDDALAIQRALDRKRWCDQNGLTEVAPLPKDAASIIRFANEVCGVDGLILCHCGAGMSRAP